jgi:3-methylcrotonyl-CoA carboxylase alpha subunit
MIARSWTWPVVSNGAFLFECLDHKAFREMSLSTGFIEDHADDLKPLDIPPQTLIDDAASELATDFALETFGGTYFAVENKPMGFRLNQPQRRVAAVNVGGTTFPANLDAVWVDLPNGSDSHDSLTAIKVIYPESALVVARGRTFMLSLRHDGTGHASAGDGAILAPMPGKVIAVDVAEGDKVTAGQRLMVLEAMKMEHALTAPFDGIVTELAANVGGQVQVEAVLCVVEPAGED